MPDISRCKGATCNAEIRFVNIERYQKAGGDPIKKPHPIDVVPDLERGSIVVVADEGIRVGKNRKAELIANGHRTFYVDHFVTCPDRQAFKKARPHAARF